MTATDERDERPHNLRVHQSGNGNLYKVTIDGVELRPAAMTVEFNEAAQYAIAKITLPVIVENLSALSVLDIALVDPFPERRGIEEC